MYINKYVYTDIFVLIAEALLRWKFCLYESWVINKSLSMCDRWFQIWQTCGGRDDFWPLRFILIWARSDLPGVGPTNKVVTAHRNWQIESAAWNLAGFLHCALETRWQRFGQFLDDLLRDFMLDFRKIASEIQHKIAILVGNPRQKSRKIVSEI